MNVYLSNNTFKYLNENIFPGRGNQNTVKIIIDYVSLFEEMIQSLTDRSKEDNYLLDLDILSMHFSSKSGTLDDVKTILLRWYGKRFFSDLEKIFKEYDLSDDYFVLFLQPGIACRIEEFNHFLKTTNPKLDSPKQLRVSFSDYLGSQIFYRAMFLTKEAVKTFEKSTNKKSVSIFDRVTQIFYRGMFSTKEAEKTHEESSNKKYILNNVTRRGFELNRTLTRIFSLEGDTYDHDKYEYNTMVDQFCETECLTATFRGDRADIQLGSPFIPCSKYPDVGINVAYWCSSESDKEKEFIVLKMNIPLIETVSNTGPFFFSGHANRTMEILDERGTKKTFSARDYEHLVYGNIPSSCIQEVQKAYIPRIIYKQTHLAKNDVSYVKAPYHQPRPDR